MGSHHSREIVEVELKKLKPLSATKTAIEEMRDVSASLMGESSRRISLMSGDAKLPSNRGTPRAQEDASPAGFAPDGG